MRKALEDLIFIGNIEDTFTLYGKEWTLRTINSEDQLSATSNTGNYDTLSRVNALKIEILSFSLISIDGIKLNDSDETLEFLKKLQMPIVNALFRKYEELQTRQDEALRDLDGLKN